MKRKRLIVIVLVAIELAICVGIVSVSWSAVSQLQETNTRLRFFQFDTVSAEADSEQRLTVSPPSALIVENAIGQVIVTGGDGNEIVVKAHKKAWGSSQADAEATLATLKVNVTGEAGTVTVRVESPPHGIVIVGATRSPTVDLTITVPGKTAVTTRANIGTIRVKNITGDLKLQLSFGGVTVERVTADIVEAHSKSGAVSLADVKASGAITLSSNFGSIEFNTGQASTLSAKTDSGSIKLTELTARDGVTAYSGFGSVQILQVQAASYDLGTRSGRITVDGANGTLKAHSEFGSVDVKNGAKVNLDLRSNNGALNFSGSLGDGPHMLETGFGNVQLTLPQDTALDMDIATNFGQIKSDFQMTMSGEFDTRRLRGTINGGGARLTASSKNGNISLNVLKP